MAMQVFRIMQEGSWQKESQINFTVGNKLNSNEKEMGVHWEELCRQGMW